MWSPATGEADAAQRWTDEGPTGWIPGRPFSRSAPRRDRGRPGGRHPLHEPDSDPVHEILPLRGFGLDRTDDIHAAQDPPECGESQPVGVARAALVEGGLRPDRDEEGRPRRVRGAPRHRESAVDVPYSGAGRALERDGWQGLLGAAAVHPALDDLDLHVVV